MALPIINETPNHELTIPSTGKKISFRPFLTKEQKVLLIAMETQDQRQILNAVVNTIKSCADDIDVNRLTTFDVEYIFTQMRAKSVGERSNVGIRCKECEHQNEVSINLENVNISVPDKSNTTIKLNDTWTLKMKYPNYMSVLHDDKVMNNESATDSIMAMVANCLDSLMSEDENIRFADETSETINDFIDNLNSVQFEQVVKFIQDMPQLKHDVNFNCESCEAENKITLKGMNDFF